jgi:hypothetical protein
VLLHTPFEPTQPHPMTLRVYGEDDAILFVAAFEVESLLAKRFVNDDVSFSTWVFFGNGLH